MKLPEFENMKYYNFAEEANAKLQKDALNEVSQKLGKTYDLYIDGKWEKGTGTFNSTNPGNKTEIVGVFGKASKEQATRAIEAANKAFQTWQFVPYKTRSEILLKAAAIMKKRRLEINAWMIKEIGKSYIEADADTCEAIDFLEWNARENLRYNEPQVLVKNPGEICEQVYIPIGVVSVIPPWNFPMAILMGMTCASLVTGNTVVLKPASDTPMMGK